MSSPIEFLPLELQLALEESPKSYTLESIQHEESELAGTYTTYCVSCLGETQYPSACPRCKRTFCPQCKAEEFSLDMQKDYRNAEESKVVCPDCMVNDDEKAIAFARSLGQRTPRELIKSITVLSPEEWRLKFLDLTPCQSFEEWYQLIKSTALSYMVLRKKLRKPGEVPDSLLARSTYNILGWPKAHNKLHREAITFRLMRGEWPVIWTDSYYPDGSYYIPRYELLTPQEMKLLGRDHPYYQTYKLPSMICWDKTLPTPTSYTDFLTIILSNLTTNEQNADRDALEHAIYTEHVEDLAHQVLWLWIEEYYTSLWGEIVRHPMNPLWAAKLVIRAYRYLNSASEQAMILYSPGSGSIRDLAAEYKRPVVQIPDGPTHIVSPEEYVILKENMHEAKVEYGRFRNESNRIKVARAQEALLTAKAHLDTSGWDSGPRRHIVE